MLAGCGASVSKRPDFVALDRRAVTRPAPLPVEPAPLLVEKPHQTVDFDNQDLIDGISKIVFADDPTPTGEGWYKTSIVQGTNVGVRVLRRNKSHSLDVFRRVLEELNGLLSGRVVFHLDEVVEVDKSASDFFTRYDALGYRKKQLDVLIVPRHEFRENFVRFRMSAKRAPRDAVCVEFRKLTRAGARLDDSIIISRDPTGKADRSCIIEEFLHFLGFLNDVDDVEHSQVDTKNRFLGITEFDQCILTFLYNAEFRRFHDRGIFAAHAQDVVRRLRPGGWGTICLGVPLDQAKPIDLDTPERTLSFTNALLGDALRENVVTVPEGNRSLAVAWRQTQIPVFVNFVERGGGPHMLSRIESVLDTLNEALGGNARLKVQSVKIHSKTVRETITKFYKGQQKETGVSILVAPAEILRKLREPSKTATHVTRSTVCRFTFSYSSKGAISRSGVVLGSDKRGEPGRRCVLGTLLGALGLHTIPDEATQFSMARNQGVLEDISPFDRCMLIFLYSPEFREFHMDQAFDRHEATVLARLRPGGQGTRCVTPGS